MSEVSWLDHDFAREPEPALPGLMHVGTVLDVDVFCIDSLDAGAPSPPFASVSATVDSDPATVLPLPGSGSSARAVEQTRSELLAQLIEVIIGQPSQWHSFILGFVRRARVDRLEELPLDVLHTVVEQAYTLNIARGGK